MSGGIAVFVKTHGLSPVKTRLAATLGKQTAEAFHLASSQSVAAVAQSLSQQTDMTAYYAVAEKSALNHRYWQDLPCLWQGENGLGERMAHIYQTLLNKHDFAILVGADIPQMTAPDLHNAVTWLLHKKSARLVFGPSLDGGFWAFGGNCPIAQDLYLNIVYSKADTGTYFFNKIKQLGDVKILSVLRDVDEEADLFALRDSLLGLAKPLPEQCKLIRFLDTLYY